MVFSHTPPVLPPPPVPLLLEEVAAPEPGQLVFRLEHLLSDAAGYRIGLRMTAAMINARKPQEPQFQRAGGTAPGSFFPVAQSGALYLLERPRFAVAPGERFGLGARLVPPEGIPGPELRVDLVRKAPEPESAAAEAEQGNLSVPSEPDPGAVISLHVPCNVSLADRMRGSSPDGREAAEAPAFCRLFLGCMRTIADEWGVEASKTLIRALRRRIAIAALRRGDRKLRKRQLPNVSRIA